MTPFFENLDQALSSIAGESSRHIRLDSLTGGCINEAFALQLNNGKRFFIKTNDRQKLNMFKTEAAALEEILQTETVNAPKPLACGYHDDQSFLLLQMVENGHPSPGFWERFGRGLAAMHQYPLVDGHYGWKMDNYIGTTPQSNQCNDGWISFFREQRLLYQGQLALDHGRIKPALMKQLEQLCSRLDAVLYEPVGPQLIHGDLWSGNFLCGPRGNPWLIDPAAYWGHGECDLAMTELFGGFSPVFYYAYKEQNPLPPGYEERREIYNLYHYLNHLNLFGSSYYSSVSAVIQKFC